MYQRIVTSIFAIVLFFVSGLLSYANERRNTLPSTIVIRVEEKLGKEVNPVYFFSDFSKSIKDKVSAEELVAQLQDPQSLPQKKYQPPPAPQPYTPSSPDTSTQQYPTQPSYPNGQRNESTPYGGNGQQQYAPQQNPPLNGYGAYPQFSFCQPIAPPVCFYGVGPAYHYGYPALHAPYPYPVPPVYGFCGPRNCYPYQPSPYIYPVNRYRYYFYHAP